MLTFYPDYFGWGNFAQWLGGVATLLAVWVALFKEPILKRYRRPKLSVRIKLEPPDSIKEIWKYTANRMPRTTNRYMFRLWVFNEGRHDRAEKVQVFAKKLEELAPDGKTFVHVKEFLPMNLVWSNTEKVTFLDGISPNGMGKHCDLCHILNPAALVELNEEHPEVHPDAYEDITVLALELEFLPFTKTYLLLPGTYRLELIIACVNALPVHKTLDIFFTGDWNENPEKMLSREGVQIRIL